MKRILVYGDSNTWGQNPAPIDKNIRYADEVRWTGILQDMLRQKAKVIEEGLCGRTVMYDDPSCPDRNGLTFLGCCLRSHTPLDLVIFMLGTNDVRHIFTPSTREIAIGMANLVKKVRNPFQYDWGKVPKVLVITPPVINDNLPSSVFYGMYDEESIKKSRALNKEYMTIFEGMDEVYTLNADDFARPSIEDSIHLTEQGHHDLGIAVAEKVKMILEI